MRQLVIPRLLLIIMLRFTCGEKKIWQSIKNSQNIMSMMCKLPVSRSTREGIICLLWTRICLRKQWQEQHFEAFFLIDRSEGNKRKYPKQSNYCVLLLRKSRLECFGNCNEKHSGKPRNRKTIKPFLSDKIKSTQKITLIEKEEIIIGDDNTAEVFLF